MTCDVMCVNNIFSSQTGREGGANGMEEFEQFERDSFLLIREHVFVYPNVSFN